jgi:hypothetical protein
MSKREQLFLAACAAIIMLIACAALFGGSSYDGNNDKIESSTAPSITTTATFCWWQNQSSANSYGAIFVNHTGTSGAYIMYADSPADELQFFIGATNAISSGFGLVDDVWTHCVCTYNAGTMRFYKDGAFISEDATLSVTIGAGTTFRLGGNQFTPVTEEFEGSLDDFRVYNRVLTDGEILALYQATRKRARKRVGGSLADTSLVMHWEFHDAGTIGTTISAVADVSGGGHNGSVSGGGNTPSVSEPARN